MTNQDLMKLFGQNIKHLRRQRGLSQQELANILDMERSHLVAIEGGKKATSFSALVKLSNIFQCSVANFFSNKMDEDGALDAAACLQEFARDYKIIKTAVAQIQTKASEPSGDGKVAIHKASYELLSLIPFLSEHAQSLVQKFAEGYLKISKSEDPLVEQIIHDILAQQKPHAPTPTNNNQQVLASPTHHYEQATLDKPVKN